MVEKSFKLALKTNLFWETQSKYFYKLILFSNLFKVTSANMVLPFEGIDFIPETGISTFNILPLLPAGALVDVVVEVVVVVVVVGE